MAFSAVRDFIDLHQLNGFTVVCSTGRDQEWTAAAGLPRIFWVFAYSNSMTVARKT